MKETLLQLLKNKSVKLCVLCTASKEAYPWCAIVAFAVTDDLTILISTNKESRKWKNIIENHNVSLVFGFDFNEPNIQCEGRATLIEKGPSFDECTNLFYATNPHAMSFRTPKTAFIAIKPFKVRMADYRTKPLKIETLSLWHKK